MGRAILRRLALASHGDRWGNRAFEKLRSYGDVILSRKSNGEPMITMFIDVPKFNVKCVEETFSVMNEYKVSHAIVVYKDGITSQANKTVELAQDVRIQLLALEDLQYNITKHILQPSFTKLSTEEAILFKKKYGIKLALMRITDPIAKFYDYYRGDIIRITRKNRTIVYRMIV